MLWNPDVLYRNWEVGMFTSGYSSPGALAMPLPIGTIRMTLDTPTLKSSCSYKHKIKNLRSHIKYKMYFLGKSSPLKCF